MNRDVGKSGEYARKKQALAKSFVSRQSKARGARPTKRALERGDGPQKRTKRTDVGRKRERSPLPGPALSRGLQADAARQAAVMQDIAEKWMQSQRGSTVRGRAATSERLGSQAESGGVVRTPRTINKSQVLGDSWASLPSYDEKALQSREDPGSMSALERMYFNQPFPRMWRDGEMGDARTLYEAPLNHAYQAAGTLGVAREGVEDLYRNGLSALAGGAADAGDWWTRKSKEGDAWWDSKFGAVADWLRR